MGYKKNVGYFYDPDVGNFYYSQGHPMKPHRMRMTHNLLLAYNMIEKMDILTSPRASEREMTRFHSDEYINFLRVVTPDNATDHQTNLTRFNILEDCPVFDGLWEYCQIAAGGSLAGAARLNAGESETVINWAGGLHHAKRSEASGFCYINDCVLAILELLKMHSRVLYVDIDIHHGDGVEEAFYTTDRVMTVSFHKHGDYFPGTGDVTDVGIGRGKNYCVNFPLKDGIDDDSYREVFTPVMTKVMEWYQPGAVVLQCGADSLSGDRLGCFNLSLKGHSQCVDFFDNYDVPLLLLGGGGYTIRNVARCWAFETSRVLNLDVTDELPYNDNFEFYGPEFRLHITPSNMENQNTAGYLNDTKAKILEQLRNLPHVPSAPMMDVPRSSPLGVHNRDYDSDNEDPEVRKKTHHAKRVQEFEDSDDEDAEYLSSLPVARRKVRKENFPRRDAAKGKERTTSTNSANLLAAANQAYLSVPGSTNTANGSNSRRGLLVNVAEAGATAASSDERVQPGPPHADDDVVDSSKMRDRKEENEVDDENLQSSKNSRSPEEAGTAASTGDPSKSYKPNDETDKMDVSVDEENVTKQEEKEVEAPKNQSPSPDGSSGARSSKQTKSEPRTDSKDAKDEKIDTEDAESEKPPSTKRMRTSGSGAFGDSANQPPKASKESDENDAMDVSKDNEKGEKRMKEPHSSKDAGEKDDSSGAKDKELKRDSGTDVCERAAAGSENKSASKEDHESKDKGDEKEDTDKVASTK